MIYLFTASEKLGSKLIRWGLKSNVSHMAICQGIHLDWYRPVVESTLHTGVHLTYLAGLEKHSKVVYALREKGLSWEVSGRLFDIFQNYIGKNYDVKGVGFLVATVIVCLKILRVKLPNTNPWGDKNDFFCSEMLYANERHLKAIGVDLEKYDRQMLTPDRAFEILLASGKFELLIGTVPA